jgi:hypothetical protein
MSAERTPADAGHYLAAGRRDDIAAAVGADDVTPPIDLFSAQHNSPPQSESLRRSRAGNQSQCEICQVYLWKNMKFC